MGKLYGLLVTAPKQEKPVTEHCFGDCGRISMGGAIMTGAGPMMMCCHDDCPHLGEQTDEPIGNSAMTGEPIYLRALTPNGEVRGASRLSGEASASTVVLEGNKGDGNV